MSEMVERCARAIRAKVPVGYGMTDAEAVEYARAVIDAMREPTDAMVDGIWSGLNGWDGMAEKEWFGPKSELAGMWRAMIDEALK